MNAAIKTTKKERILFNNPKATSLYREAITEFIALKPWEVSATEKTLTICNFFRYKINKRCRLGYEFYFFDCELKEWVRCNQDDKRYNPITRIKYFSYGQYTSFREIFLHIATDFISRKKREAKGLLDADLALAEILFLSYCKGLYRNHSYSNYVIVEWFKKTSEIDFSKIVKTGFKVGYYSAKHLQSLKIVEFLTNENLDCAEAEAYLKTNPNFLALYVYLDPSQRKKKITSELLNTGLPLMLKNQTSWELKVPKRSFNRFKCIGTAITSQYLSFLNNIFDPYTGIPTNRSKVIQKDGHVFKYLEHVSTDILLYICCLHSELGLKRPHYRFIICMLRKVVRHFLVDRNVWESNKHNIKTIYHAFYKLMYFNMNAKDRNDYIGKISGSSQLSADMDMIFDFMNKVKGYQFDKRSSIPGIKKRVQDWIDEQNKIKLESKKEELIQCNWPPRILQVPTIFKDYHFTEILNLYDLYLEGSKMNHCIYHNFRDEVEDGSVLAFHVQHTDNPDDQATLGLEFVDQDYIVFQNYGYENNLPSVGLKKATRFFLKHLNRRKLE